MEDSGNLRAKTEMKLALMVSNFRCSVYSYDYFLQKSRFWEVTRPGDFWRRGRYFSEKDREKIRESLKVRSYGSSTNGFSVRVQRTISGIRQSICRGVGIKG